MMLFVGGPMHGLEVIFKPGWRDAPEWISHRGYDRLGHYFRGEDGNYHWADAPAPSLAKRLPPS